MLTSVYGVWGSVLDVILNPVGVGQVRNIILVMKFNKRLPCLKLHNIHSYTITTSICT
jgi:hypothetical protein